MVTYHGTRRYYDLVKAKDPFVDSCHRGFESPGLGHCFGGKGGDPSGAFDAMVQWAENGKSPQTLYVELPKVTVGKKRILCPYPKRQVYTKSGSEVVKGDFKCV
jgi:hypothetical protein